jgi:4-alpha-glucanotransferase
LIASNMRHAGVLRIDHAMALSRLFWIPDGGTGADGAYVAYPFADLLGQVALESVRARCMVVGEDLGTVPEGFREVLNDADILSYRVLLLERDGHAFKPAASYPKRSVACVSTHDLPPLAGWWEGADIRERAALGLLRDSLGNEQERDAERAALVDLLVRDGDLSQSEPGDLSEPEVMRAAHAFVAATPADLVLVQAEDLAGMRVGVNLPGTDRERPNWRLRLPVPVETLLASAAARAIIDEVGATHRGTEEAETKGVARAEPDERPAGITG